MKLYAILLWVAVVAFYAFGIFLLINGKIIWGLLLLAYAVGSTYYNYQLYNKSKQ